MEAPFGLGLLMKVLVTLFSVHWVRTLRICSSNGMLLVVFMGMVLFGGCLTIPTCGLMVAWCWMRFLVLVCLAFRGGTVNGSIVTWCSLSVDLVWTLVRVSAQFLVPCRLLSGMSYGRESWRGGILAIQAVDAVHWEVGNLNVVLHFGRMMDGVERGGRGRGGGRKEVFSSI